MTQFSPYVLRTAMMLEELGCESQRAAYMVISDMHRLQAAAAAAEAKNNEITKGSDRPQLSDE